MQSFHLIPILCQNGAIKRLKHGPKVSAGKKVPVQSIGLTGTMWVQVRKTTYHCSTGRHISYLHPVGSLASILCTGGDYQWQLQYLKVSLNFFNLHHPKYPFQFDKEPATSKQFTVEIFSIKISYRN